MLLCTQRRCAAIPLHASCSCDDIPCILLRVVKCTSSHEKIMTRSSAHETEHQQHKAGSLQGSPFSRRSLLAVPVHRRNSLAGATQLRAWRGPRHVLLLRSSPLMILPPDHCRVKRRKTLVNSNPAFPLHTLRAVDEEQFSFQPRLSFVFFRQEPSFQIKDHLYRALCSSIFIKTLSKDGRPF